MTAIATPPDATAFSRASAATPLQVQARRKAEEFEAVFLSVFIEQMYAGIDTDGPFGGGSAEKTYRSLLSREYGTGIASAGGVGIADAVYREIIKAQEAAIQ